MTSLLSSAWRSCLLLGLAAAGLACTTTDTTTDVVADQRSGVWVFTYGSDPTSGMDALATGQAAIVDDCLLVGDAVVVWFDDQLDTVDDIIARVQDGETLLIEVGGGGLSLAEGGTVDDFPSAVVDHCSPGEVWFASGDPVTVEEGG